MNNTVIALVVLLIVVSGAYMYLYLNTQNISETYKTTNTFVKIYYRIERKDRCETFLDETSKKIYYRIERLSSQTLAQK